MPRGGKRDHAGRPSHGVEYVRRTVTLPRNVINDLLVLGGDNLSEGIRRAHEALFVASSMTSQDGSRTHPKR